MTYRKEQKIKKVHTNTRKWLDGLDGLKIRALASQHKIETWNVDPITKLRDTLMVIPAVAIQAGVKSENSMR